MVRVSPGTRGWCHRERVGTFLKDLRRNVSSVSAGSFKKTQEQQIQSGIVGGFRACQHQNAGAMETPPQKTEKDPFPSSASLNSEAINRTAAHREGTSLKGKMKSENKEETRVRAGMSDPLHGLFLIVIPDISHNNNLGLVTPSNNGSEGERERGSTTGGAAQRQGHEGGNPFLLWRRGVTFDISPAGRAAALRDLERTVLMAALLRCLLLLKNGSSYCVFSCPLLLL